jgi:molecular chaperone DnaJ
MTDPYKVLGVPQNATESQVKEAYRELAKKYHPDKYINNPLADLAAEKMREINEAYDYIMKNKSNQSNSNNTGYGYNNQYYNSNSGGKYNHIRVMINENRLGEAEMALNSATDRNAEWHFLMGALALKKGWHDMAYQHFARAVQMDPYNNEYRMALNNMNSQRGFYTNTSNGYGYNNTSCCTCDNCSTLLCADCCCEMMGGDIIPCC